MGKFFYAVKLGRETGVYNSWLECEKRVKGYKGAKYKKFKRKEDALDFISGDEDTGTGQTNIKDRSDLKAGEIIAYVDGSFSLEEMAYSYGLVLIRKEGEDYFKGREDDKELAEMRNVAGELKAAMVAMEKALEKDVDRLYLHYDYAGIEEWALGRWKTNRTGTRQYKDYYDSIKERLDIVFIKVAAHTGIEYNEKADQLAKEALL